MNKIEYEILKIVRKVVKEGNNTLSHTVYQNDKKSLEKILVVVLIFLNDLSLNKLYEDNCTIVKNTICNKGYVDLSKNNNKGTNFHISSSGLSEMESYKWKVIMRYMAFSWIIPILITIYIVFFN